MCSHPSHQLSAQQQHTEEEEEEKGEKGEEAAATRIQSHYRGMTARDEYLGVLEEQVRTHL